MGSADLRCDDCKVIGCECPLDYEVLELHCWVCTYRMALARAGCCTCEIKDIPCPGCGTKALMDMTSEIEE